METQTIDSTKTSDELATAFSENLTVDGNRKSNLDVINLHPDENDVQLTSEELKSIEVHVNFIKYLKNKNNKSLFHQPKDELLNPEETQPKRAPRPLFMGPKRKARGSRGARKNKNGTDSTSNGNTDEVANKNRPSIETASENFKKNEASSTKGVNGSAIDTDNDNSAGTKGNRSGSINGSKKSNCGSQTNNTLNEWAVKTKIAALKSMSDIKARSEANLSNSNETGTPKRQRSAQTTPNNRKLENQNKKRRTFANAASEDLTLYLVNKTDTITEDQLKLIEAQLNEELDNYIMTAPTTAPTFRSGFRNGILRLICTDAFSAEWFKNVVKNMPPLWNGAKLELDANDPSTNAGNRGTPIPRRPTIRFFIPTGIKQPTPEEVLTKLQFQNNPLETDNWIVWKADEKEDGKFYHVSVDENDIEIIRAKKGRLFYYYGSIKINLPKAPKREGASEMEVENKTE